MDKKSILENPRKLKNSSCLENSVSFRQFLKFSKINIGNFERFFELWADVEMPAPHITTTFLISPSLIFSHTFSRLSFSSSARLDPI